jgi:hypothetical protein
MSKVIFKEEKCFIEQLQERYVKTYAVHVKTDEFPFGYVYRHYRYLGKVVQFALSKELPASTVLKLQAFYENYKARKR